MTAVATPSKPKKAVAPLPPWRIVASLSGVMLCLLAIWAVLFVTVFSSVSHSRRQHQLYATFRKQIAQAEGPVGGVIATGTPVAILTIPQAALHGEVVVEGTTSSALRAGPGHLRTTPLPGQPGVSVVYGRSLSYGAPFGQLDAVHTGDQITATTDQGVFRYQVIDVRRPGDRIPAPPASGTGRLTLVTGEGGFTPDSVLYVDAQLVGKPAADPGGRPAQLSAAEQLMARSGGPLVLAQLVFWLQLLVVIAVVLAWLQIRWNRWQVWLIGVPLVLSVVWGASNTAMQLLPNLL